MVDERQRVLRDLMLRLEEAGIAPNAAFSATYVPGQGWTFSSESVEAASSSSSAGGTRETQSSNVQPSRR